MPCPPPHDDDDHDDDDDDDQYHNDYNDDHYNELTSPLPRVARQLNVSSALGYSERKEFKHGIWRLENLIFWKKETIQKWGYLKTQIM